MSEAADTQRRITHAREGVGRDPLATFLGIEVVEAADGRAVLILDPRPEHLNLMGRVHGSTLYALVDQAAAVAAHTVRDRSVIMEAKVNFLAGAPPDQRLTATCLPRHQGGRISLWEVTVVSGETTVALGQALSYSG